MCNTNYRNNIKIVPRIQSYYILSDFLLVGRFFVFLQIGMKKVSATICTMLLLLCYCLSIIGFDLHTCRASERTFFAMYVNEDRCSEIHPDHCCGESCCHHHESSDEGEAWETQRCCTDSYHVIQITGGNQDKGFRYYDTCQLFHFPILHVPSCQDICIGTYEKYQNLHTVDIVQSDPQVTLNIWRL